jgi:hypothetical protein
MTSTRHNVTGMSEGSAPGSEGDWAQVEKGLAELNSAIWTLIAMSAPRIEAEPTAECDETQRMPALGSADWRSAVPPELYQRLRTKGFAVAAPPPDAPEKQAAAEAGVAPLPESYQAPYLPAATPIHATESAWAAIEAAELPEEPGLLDLPPAFQGLNWPADAGKRVLVSVRPVLDTALAERVAELLSAAPGMSAVRSLGATEDIAAFEAEYDGELPGMDAVAGALQPIGASLVSTGDREFYLAIQGRDVI